MLLANATSSAKPRKELILSPSVEHLAMSGHTLTFRLITPATVRFFIARRVSRGNYRGVGSFRVKGTRGRNRVKLPRRLSPKRLRQGVYRISARAASGGPTGPLTRRSFRVH